VSVDALRQLLHRAIDEQAEALGLLALNEQKGSLLLRVDVNPTVMSATAKVLAWEVRPKCEPAGSGK